MKLFISHAVTDKALALEFKDLVSQVTMGLAVTWLSSATDGLRPGDNLWNEIHQNLNESDKIIALLTPNSIQRPWILYESGYVAGNKKANVIPILFSVEKHDLPLPLSAYMTYSGDDAAELTQFLTQTVAEIAPIPNTMLIEACVTTFYAHVLDIKQQLDRLSHSVQNNRSLATSKESSRTIDKLKASEILHQKLADPSVDNVTIIGYTNEVESGSIDHYRVRGSKTIEIYKRSILSDLSEQQRVNIDRIRHGKTTGLWNKRGRLIDSTTRLEAEFAGSDEVRIAQYFYDGPPTVRAYMFGDTEALVSYYEAVEDTVACNGSIYKGMENSLSMWVTDETVYGQFLLAGLKEQVRNLKIRSRLWNLEKTMLANPEQGLAVVVMPVMGLTCVFFDMDGVLYDSMPLYQKAWSNAFESVGVALELTDAYEHESRSSHGTVCALFQKYLQRQPTKDEMDKVLAAKNQAMQELGPAPVMAGARELLTAVVASGLKVYVVTSSTSPSLPERLAADFDGLVDPRGIIGGNDVRCGKPSPEPYLAVCDRAGCFPTQAVVIENSSLGIVSARRAGVTCLAVNTGVLDNRRLEDVGALAVFSSCGELASMWCDISDSLAL